MTHLKGKLNNILYFELIFKNELLYIERICFDNAFDLTAVKISAPSVNKILKLIVMVVILVNYRLIASIFICIF